MATPTAREQTNILRIGGVDRNVQLPERLVRRRLFPCRFGTSKVAASWKARRAAQFGRGGRRGWRRGGRRGRNKCGGGGGRDGAGARHPDPVPRWQRDPAERSALWPSMCAQPPVCAEHVPGARAPGVRQPVARAKLHTREGQRQLRVARHSGIGREYEGGAEQGGAGRETHARRGARQQSCPHPVAAKRGPSRGIGARRRAGCRQGRSPGASGGACGCGLAGASRTPTLSIGDGGRALDAR